MGIQLAENGFFFTNSRDTIQCYSCLLRIGGADTDSNIVMIHQNQRPTCFFAITKMTYPDDQHLQLTTWTETSYVILQPEILFQAVYRMRHYLIFPFMDINDEDIDKDALRTWTYNMSDEIKRPFIIVFQSSMNTYNTSPMPTLYPISAEDSPFLWFKRYHIKQQTVKNDIKQKTLNEEELIKKWNHLNPNKQYDFVKLYRINFKRETAKRIEDILQSYTLQIGVILPIIDNIIVQHIDTKEQLETISQILARRMTTITLQEKY